MSSADLRVAWLAGFWSTPISAPGVP